MPILPILLQIVLPLALIAALALTPARSALGIVAQGAATGLLIMASALVLLWTFPPWWVPCVYGLLWLAAFGAALMRLRRGGATLLPDRAAGWALTGAAALVAGGSAWAVGVALAGRTPPGPPAIDLAAPFPPGAYLAAHGGARPLINAHMKTLDESVPRFRDWRGQSYAVDFFRLGPLGLHGPPLGARDPAEYRTFGAPVLAPCAGEVIAAEAARPDMPVPEMDRARMLGNHVILACRDLHVVLAHFRQGSLRVRVGDRVEAGDTLGEAGNSGNSSEPHLHLHVQRPPTEGGAPISGAPVPFTVEGRYLVRNDVLRPAGE